MEMSYKQASKIRQSGVLDSISKRLISGESIGSSFKSSIKESTQARAVGIKEKFDPMNIAKVVTGGSNIGPALIGRLLGRSTEDLDYFTNLKDKKNKSKEQKSDTTVSDITPIPETATKIKPEKGDEVNYNDKSYRWMGAQWGEVNPKTGKTGRVAKRDVSPILFQLWSDGGFVNVPEPPKEKPQQKPKQTKVSNKVKKEELGEVLSKIYNLLQKSSEDRKKSADLEKDLEEERKTEDERRHKELVEALLKLTGGTQKEKQKNNSLLSNILGLLSGLFMLPDLPTMKSGEARGGESGKGNANDSKGGDTNKNKSGDVRGGESSKGGTDTNKGGTDTNKGGTDTNKGGADTNKGGADTSKVVVDNNKGGADTSKSSAEKLPSVDAGKNSAEKLKGANLADKIKMYSGMTGRGAMVGALKLLQFLSRPAIQGLIIGGTLVSNIGKIIEQRENNEIDDKQMSEKIQRELVATVSGVAGMELGATIGALAGAPLAAVVAPAGGVPGALVEALAIASGAFMGYSGGDWVARFLMDQFMGEPKAKVNFLEKMPPEIQEKIHKDEAIRDFNYMRNGGSGKEDGLESLREFSPRSSLESLEMDSASGQLASMAVDLTNENRDLNLIQNVAMADPVILENNINNFKAGKPQTRISGPDGSIRTTNQTINWSLRSNVRTV